MRDVNASLLPNESVQFQYTYPLWLKIAAGAAIVFFSLSLYNDLRSYQSCLITLDVMLVVYCVYWLLMMLRDSALYVVTDRRVMRLGSTEQTDQVLDYTQISGVRAWKDPISGNGYVQVVTPGGQRIRIPRVGFGRARTEWLAKLIDQHRLPYRNRQPAAAEEEEAPSVVSPAGETTEDNH